MSWTPVHLFTSRDLWKRYLGVLVGSKFLLSVVDSHDCKYKQIVRETYSNEDMHVKSKELNLN